MRVRAVPVPRVLGAALLAATVLAAAACSAAGPSAATFTPGGGMATAGAGQASDAAAPGGYVMPPFGTNVHVDMTSWLPANTAQAQAVNTDKDYELAFLYAEYTGGKSQDWTSYVSHTMALQVRALLAKPDVTTESFKGTIRIFKMRVIRDPAVTGDLDVSACFDNAKAVNTSLSTGAVLPGQSPSNDNYYRFTDQLSQSPTGQWQVISNYPIVYYPRAKECKP